MLGLFYNTDVYHAWNSSVKYFFMSINIFNRHERHLYSFENYNVLICRLFTAESNLAPNKRRYNRLIYLNGLNL